MGQKLPHKSYQGVYNFVSSGIGSYFGMGFVQYPIIWVERDWYRVNLRGKFDSLIAYLLKCFDTSKFFFTGVGMIPWIRFAFLLIHFR
ncbi:hypothetical protein DID88_008075 [Monilinia fructigena]|uniref:Uncharacterized protein n=1 Tax=Monilinia fructigena TaxID=38457 RepID=A0A395J6M4_9HELO|nr:hypothetical protein DID88_008075 [Monilinia fructigena]